MASEWFDRVTGTNDYERQSARDSFNGGRAWGDITGNVNRRLDAERAEFGTTVSGSSRSDSAQERAYSEGAYSGMDARKISAKTVAGFNKTQRAVYDAAMAHYAKPTPQEPAVQTSGPAVSQVVSIAAPIVTAGPGVPGAATVPVSAAAIAVPNAAPSVQQTGPQQVANTAVMPIPGPGGPRRAAGVLGTIGPLTPKYETSVQQILAGGFTLQPNPRTSNAEEWEIRHAEPGEFVGGIYSLASDLGYNAALVARDNFGYDQAAMRRNVLRGVNRVQDYVSHQLGPNKPGGLKTSDYAGKGAPYLDAFKRSVDDFLGY